MRQRGLFIFRRTVHHSLLFDISSRASHTCTSHARKWCKLTQDQSTNPLLVNETRARRRFVVCVSRYVCIWRSKQSIKRVTPCALGSSFVDYWVSVPKLCHATRLIWFDEHLSNRSNYFRKACVCEYLWDEQSSRHFLCYVYCKIMSQNYNTRNLLGEPNVFIYLTNFVC